MSRFTSIPTYNESLTQGRNTSQVWYRFLQAIYKGNPPADVQPISLGVSPATYVAQQKGFLIVSGGTVSLIQFSRDGVSNYTTGQTSGAIPVSAGDSLIVTYTVLPTVTFVPQ
jgi:hypothetical protein